MSELKTFTTGKGTYDSFPDKTARAELPKKLTRPATAQVGDYLRIKAIGADGSMEVEAAPAPEGGDGGSDVAYPDWSHLKWHIIGDSLTDRNNDFAPKRYYDFIADATGIRLSLDGIGGTGYGAGVSYGTNFVERVKNIPDDVDIVTIFGSANDIKYAEGANSEIFATQAWITMNRPGLRCIVVPPAPVKWYDRRAEEWTAYHDRLKLCAFVCGHRYAADMYECPPFDPNQEEHMAVFFTTDPEGIHPNEAGHRAMAPIIYNALLQELELENGYPRGGAVGDGENVTQKEVVTTVSVGSDAVTLDSTAPEQTVNLAWTVEGGRTVPAFDNYYIAKSGITYPRAFDAAQYVQFFSPSYHGDESAFAAGHQYFQAMHYRMDGDSTAQLHGWTMPITPNGQATLSGSGWCYGVSNPTGINSVSFALKNTGTGTGTIDYVYCIDITAMQEAGTIPADITTAELAELFGELPLVPGQDYPGGTIGDGTAALSINRGGSVSTVDNTAGTVTVKGGDVLSVEGGSVTFMLKTYKTVSADESGEWEGIKWVAFGDSLTDGSINADTKYHKLIAGKTGITVVDMGKGGTGYWRRSDEGNAFYQRMENVPADADIITIFGSVNDWVTRSNDVEIGTATDTIEAGTLAGYINECINVAQRRAPYAQIALITPLDYHGIPDDTMENIANIIVAVAKYRRIKCVDMYHDSGFRVDDPTFATVYCTDYSATADTYGHPSNLAHGKIIAPEFMELLKRMILTA